MAEQLLGQIEKKQRYKSISSDDHLLNKYAFIDAIAIALTQARREVWEEAAKIADTLHSYEARNVYLLRAQQEGKG